METQEKPTLVYDDKTYIIEDLSDRAKYIISQIQDLEQQASSTKAKLDQVEIAKKGFTNLLAEELQDTDENTEI